MAFQGLGGTEGQALAAAGAGFQHHLKLRDAAALRHEAQGSGVAGVAAQAAFDTTPGEAGRVHADAFDEGVGGGQGVGLQRAGAAGSDTVAAEAAALDVQRQFRVAPIASHQHLARTGGDAVAAARAALGELGIRPQGPRRTRGYGGRLVLQGARVAPQEETSSRIQGGLA